MANRQKGEATLTLKDGRTYTLRVNFHAWALTQDALTKRVKAPRRGKGPAVEETVVPTIDEIQANLQKGHELAGIALFWAALQKHHPEIRTMDDACELMEEAGSEAALCMLDALGMARPDPADIKELELKANPPAAQPAKARKPKAGTGASSVSSADASV